MVCTMLCSLYVLLPILLAKCYAFSSSISLLCPYRILFLDAYTLFIVHWLSIGHASDLH